MLPEEKNVLLNGKWKYIKDPESSLSYSNVITKKNRELNEMKVPSNWQLEGLDNYNGSVWFIKEFDFPVKTSGVKILQFNGVDYFADVWLNNEYLGKHEGYFQQFFFNISGLLKEKNLLVVKVTSPFEEPHTVWPLKKKLIKGIFNHHDCRPGGWDPERGQDKNTGGIWNNVEIITGYPVFINETKITSKIDHVNSKAILIFELNYIFNESSSLSSKVNISLTDPSGNKIEKSYNIIFSNGEKKFLCTIEIDNPVLWWSWDLGQPSLYNITISSDAFEEFSHAYGIREIQLNDNQEFVINGKRLFLRGTNIIPTQFLSELSEEKISRIVKLIKDANINIVRVHAHVNRKELYAEFDRQGILSWQDFALQWTYDSSPEFVSNAVSQIKDMVKQLYNYSSICFWCCHNEPGEQIYTLDHLLKQAVLNEDSTRIIRTASNYEEHPYDGWYWGDKEHFAAAAMGPIVTEFGAQALPSIETLKSMFKTNELFPPDWEKWQYHNFQPDQTFNIAKVEMGSSIETFIKNSQQYQAQLLKTAVEFYRRKKNKGISGIFQFMFIDCWHSITWSVVDYNERKKPGYDMLKEIYQPLFISINIRQNQYYPGKKVLIDLYIINDLQKQFWGCNLFFSLDDKDCFNMDKIDINSDDILLINYEKIDIKLPESITTGEHEMTIKLEYEQKLIASGSFNFRVVNKLY